MITVTYKKGIQRETDLTNAQCSIPNSHRMGTENWELSIDQILCLLIRNRNHETT
jgi:hypothetical protein